MRWPEGHERARGLLWDLGQPPGSPGDRGHCSPTSGGSSQRDLGKDDEKLLVRQSERATETASDRQWERQTVSETQRRLRNGWEGREVGKRLKKRGEPRQPRRTQETAN